MELSRRTFLTVTAASGAALALYDLTHNPLLADPSASKKFPVMKTEAEWKAELTPEQFKVLRKHGTERAGSSKLDKTYAAGTYICAGCQQELFRSDTKYDSGTGWPSFFKPVDGAVGTQVDRSFFTTRTEVHCSRCGGHLGHVFDDGPQPTGLRYCMNGVAMTFVPKAGDGS